jgi:hypothetical protein
MMTTMLALTVLTLIAIFIVVKRLRSLSKNIPLNDIKDAHNNDDNNHSSSNEDEPVLISTLPSKNCYVTLVQHDDDQNEYLLEKKSDNHSNGDSFQYDKSLSDEQDRTLNNHKN